MPDSKTEFQDDPPLVHEKDSAPFHVVGIGASAGGLEALESFFDHIPAGTGGAYVVVQHLSPHFKSLMDQLLARHTSLTIHRAEEGMRVEPESIYLISPRMDMRLEQGCLRLSEQSEDRSIPLPIDTFFRSLAEDLGDRAIAVVLSGTGSDGSRGIQAVKERGGVVLVQDRDSAKFDGMPVAAIATGSVDLVLPTQQLAQKVVQVLTSPSTPLDLDLVAESEEPLTEILALLNARVRINFEEYKEHTIHRRILRRMGILGLQNLAQYREVLRGSDDEAQRLTSDLLIGVTEFFRDHDAFSSLEKHLLELLHSAPDEPLRIWVAGCSTGEEAYSLAILLEELRRRHDKPVDYKIFATDVNEASIARASEGLYPYGILERFSPEVLQLYFDQTPQGLVIQRALRDKVVFAVHNLVQDPPFTRMNLVTCRNLLIYLKSEQQERIFRYLHFALGTRGLLFLGPSEVLGEMAQEFEPLDSKWRIYRKFSDDRLNLGPMAGQPTEPRRFQRNTLRSRSDLDLQAVCSVLASDKPACLVLDTEGQVLQTFGQASKYLELPAGRASLDVLKMLSPSARSALWAAMHRARTKGEPVRYKSVRFGSDEERVAADLTVHPMPSDKGASLGFVVTIGEPHELENSEANFYQGAENATRIDLLEQELQHTKEDLRAMIEQLETANEELQGTNEELLASNEELQSTNEELHSVNEELYTVNAEHHKKIEELTVLTEDMENLLQSTDIGTIFLDSELRIRKYTAKAADVVHLLPSDVGRPIEHLTNALSGVAIGDIARKVLQDSTEYECETVDQHGVPRLLRLLPYYAQRSISGLVITIVDISKVRAAQDSLARSEERFQELVENLDHVFWILAADGSRVIYVGPRSEAIWGVNARDLAEEPTAWQRSVLPEDSTRVQEVFQAGLDAGEFEVEFRRRTPEGELMWLHLKGFPVQSASGDRERIVGFVRDITESKRLQERLEGMTQELERKAQTDALTGLANRHGLESALTREMSRAARSGASTCAILVDVDNFKAVNDSLGHATGDVVLQGIASRMGEVLRPCDILARIGGDEFLALLPETRLAESLKIAERLRFAIADHSIAIADQPVRITASLGVGLVASDAMSTEEILDGTRMSLASSKSQGKNRVVGPRSRRSLKAHSDNEPSLEAQLREGRIRVASQTIRDVSNNETVGYELLSRGPEGPYENPSDFFRVSHERNILTLVDLRCLKACVHGAQQIDKGPLIHVNIFPSTLLDTPVDRIVGLMDEAGGASRFCIELSEQQFLGAPAYLEQAVRALRKAGAKVAIDDVGHGRSSLEALVVLEPDVIKIAREFVSRIDQRPELMRGLLRLVSSTASLSSMVVAEGVETESEREAILDAGVQFAQGFYWDRPALVEAVPSSN